MFQFRRIGWSLFCVMLIAACNRNAATTGHATASPPPDTTAAAEDISTVQPAELADLLGKSGDKPLLLHVGFKKLYEQAHIPGSEYLGPTTEEEALTRLKQRVATVPKSTPIIIYCGCCPWVRCPNVKPAYYALRDLGFTNARVLFISQNFGADWADKHYPVAAGE